MSPRTWAAFIAVGLLFALSAGSGMTGTQQGAPSPDVSDSRSVGNTGNLQPVAEAGPDRTGHVGDLFRFDGSPSHDPDRSGAWTAAAPLPLPIRGIKSAGVYWDGGIYVFGGMTGSRGRVPGLDLNTTWRYDLATDAWQSRASFPGPRMAWNAASSFCPVKYV